MNRKVIIVVIGAGTVAAFAPGALGSSSRTERKEIGKAIVLHGYSGEAVRVKLLQVVDPAHSSNEFITPGRGKRFMAVKLRLTNVGTKRYSDSPSNGAAVVDTRGHQFDASLFDATEPGFGSIRMGRGDFRVGYITFEVPKKSVLRTLQITLDSGFADQTGEWRLR